VRVGLLWRDEWDPPEVGRVQLETCRLHAVFAAFTDLGVAAEPVVYSDDSVALVRDQLLGLDGVLVWVNPIEQGLDRTKLDALLREVAADGVFVSAHPDVITRLATKRVLFDTREMSWGTDTHVYASTDELVAQLPSRLADGPRVLKQQRGMRGQGVWKLELDDNGDAGTWLHVEHASDGSGPERLRLTDFVARVAPQLLDGAVMVDQPYQERIAEGMIRVYLSHAQVVGFAHQFPKGLRPQSAGEPPPGKVFELPSAPAFAQLRTLMETRWMPELQQLLHLDAPHLPVIWDVDFLYGPKTPAGDDTYVLCEINASSTFAFPEFAMPTVARAALARIAARNS